MPTTPKLRTVTAQLTIRQDDEGGFSLTIRAPEGELPPILEALHSQCTFHGPARQAIAQSIGDPRGRGRSVITLRVSRPPAPPKSPIRAPSDTDPAA